MAVSGLPTKCEKHGLNIADLALDMINVVKGVNARGSQLQVTHFSWFIRTESTIILTIIFVNIAIIDIE
jgi:hypothetical protein